MGSRDKYRSYNLDLRGRTNRDPIPPSQVSPNKLRVLQRDPFLGGQGKFTR